MPKGGKRIGAGRKPGAAWNGRGVVLGLDGVRRATELPPAITGPERDGLLKAPAGLSASAGACWERWAEQAIAERTLTPATAAGFGQMCERGAYVAKLAAKIEFLGADTQEAVPYLSLYDRMAQKLEGSLGRFKLTAFGKPATSDKPKASTNPFAQVAGQ